MGFRNSCRNSSIPILLPFLLLLTTSFAQAPTSVNSVPTNAPSPLGGYASTGPASEDNGGDDANISTYLFLLIGAFVIIIVVSSWVCIRRHRMIPRNTFSNGPPAEPPRRRGANSRWRRLGLEPRLEEGLNEQGEAPPPYIPGQPPPAAHVNGILDTGENPIPLQTFMGKPPDYHASSSEEDLGMLRSMYTHPYGRDHLRDSPGSPISSSAVHDGTIHSDEMIQNQAATSTPVISQIHEPTHNDASMFTESLLSNHTSSKSEAVVPPTMTMATSQEADSASADIVTKETHD